MRLFTKQTDSHLRGSLTPVSANDFYLECKYEKTR